MNADSRKDVPENALGAGSSLSVLRFRDDEEEGVRWAIPVVFEDEALLVVDKPPGLPVFPDRYAPKLTSLASFIRADIRAAKPWAVDGGFRYLEPVHDLDLEASGLLVLAKAKEIRDTLANRFGSEQRILRYVAFCRGAPGEPQFEVDVKILKKRFEPWRMAISSKRGRKTVTQFEVHKRFDPCSIVHAFPLTHRRHQVRIHMAHAGCPIVGDSTYGGGPLHLSEIKPKYRQKREEVERSLIPRVALHADRLEFPHPSTGDPFTVEVKGPKYFRVAGKYLSQYALRR